ncbi:hypothetical protein [Caballeronia sp. INDeC2]|uniref:hypothetical protein n=1 Tax=Caballeronia sp. INDeC2 TaxID=2921747 RepID=UPI00202975FD|nr:hypothetical protein [Caballeronia sp. INDeC2]
MSNIGHLISLTGDLDKRDWISPLLAVLNAADAEEIHGNPQSDRVSFILQRARMRQNNSTELGLETFGLQDLISQLEKLPTDEQLLTYGIRTALHSGNCFVFNGRLIGCEFVRRGMSRNIPFQN